MLYFSIPSYQYILLLFHTSVIYVAQK